MSINTSEQKYKFGGLELGGLVVNLIISKSLTNMPKSFLEGAGSAAFLSALLTGAAAYLFIWFLPILYRKAGADIITLCKKRLPMGFVFFVLAVTVGYAVVSAADVLSGICTFSLISAYPSAPFMFVALFFSVAAVAAVFRGMNGIIRANSFMAISFSAVTLVFLFFAAGSGSADVTNLFPVMGRGLNSVLKTAVCNLAYYADVILIFLISPFFDDKKSVSVIRASGAIGILINLFVIFCANAIIPFPSSTDVALPLYQLMKRVYMGRFLQRVDAVYLFFAALSAMGSVAFSVFIASYALKEVLGLDALRPLAPIVSLTVLMTSLLIYRNNISDIMLIYASLAVILLAAAVFLPCLSRTEKGGENK